MIRPITCVAAALAIASGYYVYYVSHQVSLLDRQIERTVHQSSLARERIRMLHAEWTVLNRPERLQRLADQYLSLQPTKPDQFVSMADLAGRLPPPAALVAAASQVDGSVPAAAADPVVGAPGHGAAVGEPVVAAGTAPDGTASASAGGTARGTVAPAPAVPVPAAAVRVASVSSRPAPPPVVAVAHRPHRPSADRAAAPAPLRPRVVASVLPRPAPPRPWTPPRPAAVRLVPAGYRAPAYRPLPPAGGSLLGMAHTYSTGRLAPPAPMPMPTASPGGGD